MRGSSLRGGAARVERSANEKEREMTPGPTIIRECSACGKHIAQDTIASGNTFGARFWTDGKSDAPMLPDQPWLVRCGHCGALVWIDEQRQVGEIEPWGPDAGDAGGFPDARPASTPTLRNYASLLEVGVSDRRKLRYLRLRAWWAGNDSRRDVDHPMPLDALEVQNLREFLALLDEGDGGDRLMKAEAYRELGDFAEAENLLGTEFDDELSEAVSIIRDLTRSRISAVAEMRLE
jgi:hypothetical protein